MKLTIIVPVYNEEKTIQLVLEKLISVKLPCKKEIIVVDDGSSDETRNRIKNYELRIKNKKESKIKIIFHKSNLGKGAAIRSGIKYAIGDYILIQDADLEYNPDEIPRLLSVILVSEERAHPESSGDPGQARMTRNVAVYGSRFLNHQATIPLLYLLGNKFLTFLTNLLYGTKLTDMETGYKLLPASFIKKINLTSNHFDFEPEITVKLIKAYIPIREVSITYTSRSHFAGKKLTVKDALGAIKILVKNKLL